MKPLPSAVLGGLLASLAMDLAQGGFAEVFERGRDPGELDEEVEAIASVVRLIERYAPFLVPTGRSETVGHVLHYLFGAGFGIGYAAVRSRANGVAAGGGTVFGVALWLLSDRLLIPMTKLGRPWARYSLSERSNALVSHLAYGLTLEAVMRRARR